MPFGTKDPQMQKLRQVHFKGKMSGLRGRYFTRYPGSLFSSGPLW
jgi:hypothetical protein